MGRVERNKMGEKHVARKRELGRREEVELFPPSWALIEEAEENLTWETESSHRGGGKVAQRSRRVCLYKFGYFDI